MAQLAREAVLALERGDVLDLSRAEPVEGAALASPGARAPARHALRRARVEVQPGEVEQAHQLLRHARQRRAGQVDGAASTGRAARCGRASPRAGRPTACSRRARRSSRKIVRESYVPSPADFLSGAVKSNDVSLLMTFQKVFELDQPSWQRPRHRRDRLPRDAPRLQPSRPRARGRARSAATRAGLEAGATFARATSGPRGRGGARRRGATGPSTAPARSRAGRRTPRRSIASTSRGRSTVLDACEAAGVARVVVASTSGTVAVSDDPRHVATEDDEAPTRRSSPAGRTTASKLYAERAALERERTGRDSRSSRVNPSAAARRRGTSTGSSTEDVRLFLERRIPAVPGGGLSFVDARDAAEAMALAMEKGRPGRTLPRRGVQPARFGSSSRASRSCPGCRRRWCRCRACRVLRARRTLATPRFGGRGGPHGDVSRARPGEPRDGAVLLVPRLEPSGARARVVTARPDDDPGIPRAEAIAAKIIANAPLAVQYAMEAVNKGMEMTLAEGLYLEAVLFAVCCSTEDKKEGTTAFLEKRTAQFKGK